VNLHSSYIYLRAETQQRIEAANSKVNGLSSSLYENLGLQMLEIKQAHTEISKKLHDYKNEVEI
jgi:hypothetical protein